MRLRFAILFCVGVLGCQTQPENLREWRASDHDYTSEPGNDQVEVPPDGGSAPELAAHGLDEVTLVAWQQNCTRCHGLIGQGDGPQGPALHATDLTNPAWQRSVNDEQVTRAIRQGRGMMPPFSLPDSTVAGLVRLIRLLDLSRGASDAGAPDAATAATADAGRAAPSASASGKFAPSAPPRASVAKPPASAPSAKQP